MLHNEAFIVEGEEKYKVDPEANDGHKTLVLSPLIIGELLCNQSSRQNDTGEILDFYWITVFVIMDECFSSLIIAHDTWL